MVQLLSEFNCCIKNHCCSHLPTFGSEQIQINRGSMFNCGNKSTGQRAHEHRRHNPTNGSTCQFLKFEYYKVKSVLLENLED